MKVKTEDASYVDYFSSPIGLLEVLADDNGVTALRFVDQQQAPRDSDFTKTVLRQLSERLVSLVVARRGSLDYSRFDHINSDSEQEWLPLAAAWTSPKHEQAYQDNLRIESISDPP